jgi:hypothetical protein
MFSLFVDMSPRTLLMSNACAKLLPEVVFLKPN